MPDTLGKRIRIVRSAQGLTQIGAAKGVGMHPVTWNRFETGARLPRLPQLARIARALKVDVRILLTGVEIPGHSGKGS